MTDHLFGRDADLLRKANRAIERQTNDAKGWVIEPVGHRRFRGQFNWAELRIKNGRYVIEVFENGTDVPILKESFKGLGPALRNGRTNANTDYTRSRREKAASPEVKAEAQRLGIAWRNAYNRRYESSAMVARETESWDALVDFVEANNLNYTRWDPRED